MSDSIVIYAATNYVPQEAVCYDYLQNKLDGVPFSVLVKMTSDFYPVEVIKAAKNLLFISLMKVPGHRLRFCIGLNKAMGDVHDMIKLLLSAELAEVTIFLA